MSKNLVIVESPAKAKTIEKFLGSDFKVTSCYGHIVDLPSKELGVNIDKGFQPKYIVSNDKKKVVTNLKSLAKNAEFVWLASDEDREGEAIAWHLSNALKLDDEKTKRIVFHEITKKAILDAIKNPRKINYDLVNAQQARRILDRLVGYQLSPVLWKKIKGGLSAGRVQSVSVRLIVEREREINSYSTSEYYKTNAEFLTSDGKKFKANLETEFKLYNEVEKFLQKNIKSEFSIISRTTKPALKSPAAPFTTSTMQQEASRKLSFSVSKTMTLAQRLYESGLITYMRTDSVNLSNEAKSQAKAEIIRRFGEKYYNAKDYKNKSSNAQEAHEAIRPTNFKVQNITADYDQKRLYELIWKRTISSQMSQAKLERTTLKVGSNSYENLFIAKGEILIFDGFLKVYLESLDEEEEKVQGILPDVKIGDNLKLSSMESIQRFSRPPSRYTEASLVRKLEELGIGRPSTYAPTISTIQARGYILKGENEGIERNYKKIKLQQEKISSTIATEKVSSEKGKLIPSDIGIIVNDFLVNNFEEILNYNFTALVEKNFDKIASGNEDWSKMIENFYTKFQPVVEDVKENANRESGERILGKDPKSGRTVRVRLGKFGPIAQIGVVEDEEKPVFASLQLNQTLESISLEEALILFKLPRKVGDYDGNEITANNGRFGPYIKYADSFVSIPKNISPFDIDLNMAIELIQEKEKANMPIHEYKNFPVTKGKGRFGPFIKWNKLFINVNNKFDFENLSLEDIEFLIDDKLKKEEEKIIKVWEAENIKIEKARWGRYKIIHEKGFVELSKDSNPSKFSLNEVKNIISQNKTIKPKKKTS
ncbi:MAG: type I DNA topoisomerase [Flavobacteriaceae bacterium]|tara:strand:- start:6547 stop:9018 length:2472 start_codon:yes stop_codon:yes gene_type:complete